MLCENDPSLAVVVEAAVGGGGGMVVMPLDFSSCTVPPNVAELVDALDFLLACAALRDELGMDKGVWALVGDEAKQN